MRKKCYHWDRRPKTYQERKKNQDWKVRGKRKNLPTAYDDIPCVVSYSWKDRRKTQYRSSKRGQKHEIVFSSIEERIYYWHLFQEYVDKDIPCWFSFKEGKFIYYI